MTKHLMPNYSPLAINITKGEAAKLWAGEKLYYDFASGVAVTALGHNHPQLMAALEEAIKSPWHLSNWLKIPGQEKVAEQLCKHSFADSVYFCNSGAEAIETGLKVMRRWQHSRGSKRHEVITFSGAFHGRTFAAMTAGGNPVQMEGYAPYMPGFKQLPWHDFAAVEQAINAATAGILIEPIQGEGGLATASPEFMQHLRALADKHDLLIMLDEIQTGMGRTGKLWAHEWSGITPDIMALAKGLGGGFPIGATLMKQELAAVMTPGSHGSTFGGNPLAMAVAKAVLGQICQQDFIKETHEKGQYLQQKLNQLQELYPKTLLEVRGKGLLLGVKFITPALEAHRDLCDLGLLTVPAQGQIIRLLPPLIISQQEIDAAVAIIAKYCQQKQGI